jgi:hypothetical protein
MPSRNAEIESQSRLENQPTDEPESERESPSGGDYGAIGRFSRRIAPGTERDRQLPALPVF